MRSAPSSGKIETLFPLAATSAWCGAFSLLKQFQEKCEAVFRPELRKNKKLERPCASIKS
jgi:hypothetical protein